MDCFYYLYKNLNTGALLWSKKNLFDPDPIDLNKWDLIGDFYTKTQKLILYADYIDRLD